MRELNQAEIAMVNGAWASSLGDAIEGAVYGLGAGLATGVALGGINTKSDGLGIGVIAQGVGAVVGGVIGAVEGVVGGFLFGKDDITTFVNGYTDKIGM